MPGFPGSVRATESAPSRAEVAYVPGFAYRPPSPPGNLQIGLEHIMNALTIYLLIQINACHSIDGRYSIECMPGLLTAHSFEWPTGHVLL